MAAPLRLLADENVPASVVRLLRTRGHDVTWIMEVASGIEDRRLLEMAEREDRILLTFDKDFGELAFSTLSRPLCGVILLRFFDSPSVLAEKIADLLETRTDWISNFAVVTETKLRLRPLKSL